MKNIKTIIAILLLLTGILQGCGNFLDVDIPDTLEKKNYWKTKEQVYAALTGVYTKIGGDFKDRHNNIALFLKWGDLRSDIYSYGSGSGDGEKQFVRQDIYTSNTLNNWVSIYEGINWANSFLKNARGASIFDPSLTLEEVQSMESEVYAIRALYYFYLVRAFREVPVVVEPYESDTQSPYGPALPETQVLDSIEKDLSRALAHAPETFTDPIKRYGRITQNAVKALWADVKLWRGEDEACIKFCEELDNVYEHSLVDAKNWFTIFSIGNSPESIFEFQYLEKGIKSPVFGLYSYFAGDVAGPFAGNRNSFNKSITKVYPATSSNWTSDTVRIDGRTWGTNGSYGFEVYKYTGIMPADGFDVSYRTGSAQSTVNFIFYRYREVMFMKAEALAMLERYDEAVEVINKIRKATGLPTVTPGEYGRNEIFFEKLLCERIAELGFEGKQWFSMVRMARRTGYTKLLIDRIAETTSIGVKPQTMRARLLDPESWFLPYFQNEVDKNPALEQKKFYEGKK